jgi:hypothetical protein
VGIETVVPAAGMLAKQKDFEKDDTIVDNFIIMRPTKGTISTKDAVV